jgi:hypothetical protein
MNIYCAVSIDTECDRGSHWKNPSSMTFKGVIDLVPHVFQKTFQKHGVKPTYLLSPEVIGDKQCVDVFKSLTHVELGTHLHCEFVEPLKKPWGEYSSDFQAMYPPEIEAAKLKNLTHLFIEKFGFNPTSFRAGRWGISPHTFKILENLGYLVDSSVTPYVIWTFPQYVLNYKTAIDIPYFPSDTNFLQKGQMRLLQVPVTIVSRYGQWLNQTMKGSSVLKDVLLGVPLWRPMWLRPTYSDFNQMKQVIDMYISFHRHEKNIVLNMMFHNVEILPEGNPYDFDQKRIADFLDHMERIFDYLNRRGVKFVGLTDIYKAFKSSSS